MPKIIYCRYHPPVVDLYGDVWHPGYPADNCPECKAEYEASLPDSKND